MRPIDFANHPRERLLFFLAQDVGDSVRAKVHDFVLKLASLREWLNGPPQFVDEMDEPPDASHGDKAVETLGGYIEIYSARPPWSLPPEIDRQHLDEVTTLVTALRQFASQNRLAFELELNDTFVGMIKEGEMDRSLSEGLLGEWKRQLDA
jgi:hypothetical protein